MFKVKIQPRFRDTDGMGHVNNSVFLTYLELARIEFFKHIFGLKRSQDISFILARVEIDFKRPITLEDQPSVELWVSSIGTTSWWFEYKIFDQDNASIIFAEAKSVQLVYDYENSKKEKIPDSFRSTLSDYMKKS